MEDALQVIQSGVEQMTLGLKQLSEAQDNIPAGKKATQDQIKKFQHAYNIWKNDGWERPDDKWRFKNPADVLEHRIGYMDLVDAMTPADAPILIPQVISRIVKEAMEPVLVGETLLQTLRLPAGTQHIEFPATSAFSAAEIAPGEEYPERSIEAAGTVIAKIGKHGVAVRITDEMIRYSMFDVMSLHLRAAGRAMARHKETIIFNAINNDGVVSFDNSGGTSLHGKTSGRNVNAVGNDTFTLDDLFVMYADLVNRGFTPDTLIMNPMGWLIFARDPVLRAFGFANGGPMWQPLQGKPGLAPWQTVAGGLNLGPSAGGFEGLATTSADVPNLFPAPFTIVVSPFVAYNSTTNKTSIIMADRNELGVLVVDEDLVTEDFDDPKRDIRSVKLRERYAVATLNEGEGIAIAKNVSVARGFDYEDKLTWEAGTGNLPVIS